MVRSSDNWVLDNDSDFFYLIRGSESDFFRFSNKSMTRYGLNALLNVRRVLNSQISAIRSDVV